MFRGSTRAAGRRLEGTCHCVRVGSANRPGVTPSGSITRGTTNPNRLRRIDRWLTGPGRKHWAHLRHPLAVDLGYGHTPVTTVEMFHRLRAVHPGVELIGIEIDPDRVQAAKSLEQPQLSFAHGGFEIPIGDRQADVIRAFNVLRQYPAPEVPQFWRQLTARLAPDGICLDGTCDELGRLASWITLSRQGPQTLSFSWRLAGLTQPSAIAARLPKALIHRNTPGDAVFTLLSALDSSWERNARMANFGLRQRFLAMAAELHDQGWPIEWAPKRWRLGELTFAWAAVDQSR